MQDRSNIDVDPTLVDRGWTQMQQQLDEVMPEGKRRVFPWFWLLFFIVVSSSAGVYQTFQSEKNIDNESMLPSSLTPSTKTLETMPVAELNPTKSPVNTEEKESINEVAKTNQEENRTNVLVEEPIVNEAISSPAFENKTSIVSTQKMDSNELVLNENDTQEEQIFSQNKLGTGSVKIETTSSIQSEEQISLLTNNGIALLENKESIIEKTISFKTAKRSRLFVMTEAETGLGDNPQGLAIGAGWQHSLGKKLSVELGLNYQIVSTDLITNTLGINKNNDNSLEPANNIYGDFTYSISQTYDRMEIRKFNLPIQVRFKAGNRWHLAAGIQTSYYHQAFVEFDNEDEISTAQGPLPNVGSLDLYDESIPVFRVNEDTNVASLPYDLQPNRWQWSSLLSVQYEVSKRIGLDVKYRHNLTKWPDTREAYGAKSYLSLGLRYYVW